jgi:hypothetical protein
LLKKVSPTNLLVARIAAMLVRTMAASPLPAEKCSLQYVLLVEKKHKYHLSLEKIDLFIAANVFPNKDKIKNFDFVIRLSGRIFFVY